MPLGTGTVPPVAESMTAPELDTSAIRLVEVTCIFGTRAVPEPKPVVLARSANAAFELWIIGNSCECPDIATPTNAGPVVGHANAPVKVPVVPVNAGAVAGHAKAPVNVPVVPAKLGAVVGKAIVPDGVKVAVLFVPTGM